jgi:NAD(P)-dependent dehydrogenase (short-subunit alcohol dehydrogenase family)
MTKRALPMLKKRKEAVIINIASMAGHEGYATLVPYCGTKFGVRGFTKALAEELPKRIRTYVVNPCMTATRMTDFEGVLPEHVADIIVRTAKETLRKKSGDDVDIPDYL